MDDLVRRLSEVQSVRAEYASSAADLKAAIDRGMVHVKFTETKGGTCLSVKLDTTRSVLSEADFGAGTGQVHFVGTLVLNYNEVELNAHIDLATLQGSGSLKLLADEAAWRAKRSKEDSDGQDPRQTVH